jgi:hypothetical protein
VSNDPLTSTTYAATVAGYIRIDVVDELAGVASPNTVYVNVYMRGGSDLQFNAPNLTKINDLSYYAGVGGLDLGPSANAASTLPLCETAAVPLFGPALVPPEVSLVYFGEAFESIRSLVKTYCAYAAGDAATVGAIVQWGFVHPRSPIAGFSIGDSTNGWNRWTFLSWLSTGFFAQRGGVRWKVNFHLSANTGGQWGTQPEKVMFGASLLTNPLAAEPATNATHYVGGTPITLPSGLSIAPGHILKVDCAGPTQWFGEGEVAEIEVPMAITTRFTPAANCNPWECSSSAQSNGQGTDDCAFVVFGLSVSELTDTHNFYNIQCAAAEDFSLVWFLHAPIVRMGGARCTAA